MDKVQRCKMSDAQRQLEAVVAAMDVDETITIPGRGGWQIAFIKTDVNDGLDLTHYNPVGDTGQRQFFAYDTTGDPYGAGKIVQEPSLRISLRNCGVPQDGWLVGAIALGEDGAIKTGPDGKPARYSWSNLVFVQHRQFTVSDQGELKIDGVSHGFLAVIFLPDKKRLDGWVGIFTPTRPEAVRVGEMEQVAVLMARVA